MMQGNRVMPTSQLAEKTLDILEVLSELRNASLPEIQARSGLPLTTTHRIVQMLIRRGYVLRVGRSDYRLGTSAAWLSYKRHERDLLEVVGRKHLPSLAKLARSHVHLGVFEDGMVTYLVKQRYGNGRLHSAEGQQLEAYCSALGKVLLSVLSETELDDYLAGGPLIALTPNTIVEPDRLKEELNKVRIQGWAADDEEIAVGLRCVAVPIRHVDGGMLGAISVSVVGEDRSQIEPRQFLRELNETASAISRHLFPTFQAR